MTGRTAELEKRFKERIKALRFFDANCWVGRTNFPGPCYLHGLEEITAYLEHCGVGRAVLTHALARFSHPTVGNSLLLEALEGARGGAGTKVEYVGSFVLLPDTTGELGSLERYIDGMLKAGARTARIFPRSHNYSLGDWSCRGLLARLEERRIPLFIWPRETSWEALHETAAKHPGLPLVLEQCEEEAYWNMRHLIPLMAGCPNVHVETNKGHLYLGIDEIVKRFGSARVIYGSNLPADDPFASLMLVTDGDFPDADKRRIAHENIEALIDGVIV